MKIQFRFPTQLGRIAFSTRFVSILYRPSSRYRTNASHWPRVYRIALPSGLLGNTGEPTRAGFSSSKRRCNRSNIAGACWFRRSFRASGDRPLSRATFSMPYSGAIMAMIPRERGPSSGIASWNFRSAWDQQATRRRSDRSRSNDSYKPYPSL